MRKQKQINKINNINEYQIIKQKYNLQLVPVKENMNFYINTDDFYYELVRKMNQYYSTEDLLTESAYIIPVDKTLQPMGIMEIGRGDEVMVKGSDRNMVHFLSMIGSNRYVYIHNHPEGEEFKCDIFSESDKAHRDFLVSLNERFNIELKAYMLIYKEGLNCLPVKIEKNNINQEIKAIKSEMETLQKNIKRRFWI